eukprot:TRINITY_DN1490_c1_g2_i1.p1 TRINITY_DN1490_c1_g2~~TRINITY_DN1490_c1_g2_i1.p1  ORF type:complete len:160 (-),score=84.63 TRINITY_DN1490_c1_g2_i1:277-756(-)
MALAIPNPPSFIEYKNYRFLIFDAPNDDNLPLYIEEFRKYHVSVVVRACDPTYSTALLAKNNINLNEMNFPDGTFPSGNVIREWGRICEATFKGDNKAIGVHCIAGLGRAPVLVAIALINEGLTPIEAVNKIRERRRGAINTQQIEELRKYSKGGCIIS